MAHVTFIHGILNKPPRDVLLAQWHAALATNAGIDLAAIGCTTRMVYWADVLYPQPEVAGAQESVAPDLEIAPDLLLQIAPALGGSQQEAKFVAGLAGKFTAVALKVAAAEAVAPTAGPATEAVPLPWSVKEPLMAHFLRDVHHYLFNVEFSPRPGLHYFVQDEIRRRFVDALHDPRAQGTRHIVISHSMGTVIAYDCLKRVSDSPVVDELMTIGSPLGLDEIEEKLQPEWTAAEGFPAQKLRGSWANVFDRLDPVCGFAPRLAADYRRGGRQVVGDNEQVNSGWWRHDIAKYFGGDVLRRALRTQLGLAGQSLGVQSLEGPSSVVGGWTPGEVVATATSPTQPLPIVQAAAPSTEPTSTIATESAAPGEDWVPSLDDLVAACKSYNRAAAKEICARWSRQLANHAPVLDTSSGAAALKQLRRKRYLEELAMLADALLEARVDSPEIRRLYAQALIDSAKYVPAELILKDVIASCKDKHEEAECRGLLGRIHKQLYVDAGDDRSRDQSQHLLQALEWYYGVYKQQPETYAWHGVNVMALAARAGRDGVPIEGYPSVEALATRLLAQWAEKQKEGQLDAWGLASAIECYVALGDMEHALEFAKAYVACPEADAFELNSSLRQFTEVWQLGTDGLAGMLLMLLKAELLKRQGGQLRVDPDELAQHIGPWNEQDLQKVFGADKYQTLEWYRRGLVRTQAVGRFETSTGRKVGTAFIVNARKTLHDNWPNEYVLLTNSHVVSNEPNVTTALRPQEAFVTFESWEKSQGRYRVRDVLWTSATFDATVVRLDPPLADCETCDDFTSPPKVDGQARVYMIGYPLGGGLAISLNDNLLLGYLDPRLHYRTPSDPGSSGSPVFDNEWRLVALHHAGSPTMRRLDGAGVYEANEGISIDSIRAAIAAANKSAAEPPAKSATESPTASRAGAKIVTCGQIRTLFGGSLDSSENVSRDGSQSLLSAAGPAMAALLAAISAAFPQKSDRETVVKQLRIALRQLRDDAADHEPAILFSPTNRLASLLQSTLANNLPSAGTNLEFAFDSKDTKEVLKEFFAHAKNLQKHAPMRPKDAQPGELADDASVFLVSDFGTGLYGAPRISQTIAAASTDYELLLHLGDVYYSGQPDEVRDRLLAVWPKSKGRVSRTLNGNHDMYSGGQGYFDVALDEFQQPSSYFALQNKHWTLICLDTSYEDNDLDDEQVAWIKATVEQADERGIVLFSHHPLFSNFKDPGENLEKKLKKLLKDQRITAWYWGHEHHCVLYDRHADYQFYGRCLGHGGMPSKRKHFEGMSPVKQVGDFTWLEKSDVQTPKARYLDGPNPYIFGHEDKYTPHGYMTLEFAKKQLTENCYSAEGKVLHSMSITA